MTQSHTTASSVEPSALQFDMLYDENDIESMLPPEPSLQDVDGDMEGLRIYSEARDMLIYLWNVKDNHNWKYLKRNKQGMELYKGKPETSTEFLALRIMQVDSDMDSAIQKMREPETAQKSLSGCDKVEIVRKFGDY